MRVLFLDVDGVLNSRGSVQKHGPEYFIPEAIERVNAILLETGAVLVLSSDWRFLDDTDILLREAGLVEQHPDKLSRAIDDRREAAMKWLSEHQEVERWCAIDDMPLWSGHAPSFVKTSAKFGLSRGDARRAIAILNGP